MPNVVKVFVWAPMSDCIKNVKVLEPSLSDKEAERKIKRLTLTAAIITATIPAASGTASKTTTCV